MCWCVGFVLGCGSFKLGSVCGWLLVADIIFCSEAVVVVCVVGFRCRVWCFLTCCRSGLLLMAAIVRLLAALVGVLVPWL